MKNKMPGEEQNQSKVTVDGPGSQLRRARERQGIEQSTVAAQLHLSQAKVEALEWDDYEKLPSAVFVQGYLRNYARLLGVNEAAVISAYQALNPGIESQPLPRNQPDEVARELHSNHSIFRYITWVVVLLLGVLLFFWWQGRMQLPEIDELAPVEESPGDRASPPFQEQLNLNPVAPETDISLPLEEAVPIPDRDTTGFEPAPSEPPIDTRDNLPTVADEPPLPVEDATSPIDLETPSEVSQETDRVISASAVFFEFLGPCWVEVRDATGRARLMGEMRTGVRRTLDSAGGPYQVVIGDINAVRLMVNGEPFELKAFARGKVARFTLDPAQL